MVSLGTAAVVHAETFPVTATVRFETGLRKLATITLENSATVDWGDGSAVQAGLLVNCRDTLNQTCDIYGTHTYQTLGNHPITITYTPRTVLLTDFGNDDRTVVPVGDFVVLSIGDSVASGEGNPVVARFEVWDGPVLVNRVCGTTRVELRTGRWMSSLGVFRSRLRRQLSEGYEPVVRDHVHPRGVLRREDRQYQNRPQRRQI